MRKVLLLLTVFLAGVTLQAQECESYISLTGMGIAGQNSAVLAIDANPVDSIIVEAIYKSTIQSSTVRFWTSSEEIFVEPENVLVSGTLGTDIIATVYRATFGPTDEVNLDFLQNESHFFSFAAYAYAPGTGISSTLSGELYHVYLNGAGLETDIPIPVSADPRTVTLRFGITELNDDIRQALFEFRAGGQFEDFKVRSWDANSETESYTIQEVTFYNVPGNIDNIIMTQISDVHGESDSWIGGVVIADIPCEDTCIIEPMVLGLETRNQVDGGYVTITNDDEFVFVNFVSVDGWRLTEAQLYIGAKENIPLNIQGTPDREKFFYNVKFDPTVTSYDFKIPLAELEECFVVLAHVKVKKNDDECGPCDGKATELTMMYNGATTAQISVEQKKDNVVVFDETVEPGGIFTFYGTDKKGTLGTEIIIKIDGVENARIHTSCSVPLYIGLVEGEFTLMDGYSRNGGQFCVKDIPPPTDPECGTCDGKITLLSMIYNGASDANITVRQKKGDDIVFDGLVTAGGAFAFSGTDKGTLGTEIYLSVDGVENTAIHTSCSKPVYIGMVSGDFTIIDGYSKNGGQLCTTWVDKKDKDKKDKGKKDKKDKGKKAASSEGESEGESAWANGGITFESYFGVEEWGYLAEYCLQCVDVPTETEAEVEEVVEAGPTPDPEDEDEKKGTTGINDANANMDLVLYPNPTTEHFYINVSADKGNINSIDIFSITGRMIKKLPSCINTGPIEVNVGDVENGIYFVRVNTDAGVLTRKFEIQ